MKRIVLKQYIEAFRTVSVWVKDNETELDAAEKLNNMPVCLEANEIMPDNATVIRGWSYVSDRGIENLDGETVLRGDEEGQNLW